MRVSFLNGSTRNLNQRRENPPYNPPSSVIARVVCSYPVAISLPLILFRRLSIFSLTLDGRGLGWLSYFQLPQT